MTTISFDTAQAYADHLSTVIDDEDLVITAVRRRFPQYGLTPTPKPAPAPKRAAAPQRMSCSSFKEGGAKKPAADDVWMSSDVTDRRWRSDIADGSTKLLASLWNAHPVIMQQLGAVQP